MTLWRKFVHGSSIKEDVNALDKRICQVLEDEGIAIVVFYTNVTAWDSKDKNRLSALKKKYAKNKNVILWYS